MWALQRFVQAMDNWKVYSSVFKDIKLKKMKTGKYIVTIFYSFFFAGGVLIKF